MRTIKTRDRRRSPKTYPREGLAKIVEAAGFLNCERPTVYAMIHDDRRRTVTLITQMRIPWKSLWAYHDGRPESQVSTVLPITAARIEAIERSIGEILKLVDGIRDRLDVKR